MSDVRRHRKETSGDRHETETERLDRNWTELLQELRVVQTGTQILTGFLLALAFQPKFDDLDQFEVGVYLTLVVLAVLTTVLSLSPVSLHRTLFRQHAKREIVEVTNRVMATTLVSVSLVLVGTVLLVFDVVASRSVGIIAGACAFVVILLIWIAVPLAVRARRDDST